MTPSTLNHKQHSQKHNDFEPTMKSFIIIMFITLIHYTVGQPSVKFGLLVCEQGPVIFRQTTSPGVTFQIKPPSQSQCTAGTTVCNSQFGFFASHSGLSMCSVSRDCGSGEQICLRRNTGGSSTIEGCCKVAFEAWALSGVQEISGIKNPTPQPGVRMLVQDPAEDN